MCYNRHMCITSNLDFPITEYYVNTFIVGAHHSTPHLIRDLKRILSLANNELQKSHHTPFRTAELHSLLAIVTEKLSTLNLDEESDLELAEPVFWVNQLGRQCSIEISTYGRIRPETMNLLICLPDDDFVAAMAISGKLVNRIQQLGESSLNSAAPIPPTMPVVS